MLVDGLEVPFLDGDTVLVAMLRRGEHPTAGGCLCLAGDCPHCLARVDGVAYVRTCQIPAQAGLQVERHPRSPGLPPVESRAERSPATMRHRHCDVVVIGQGPAGRRAAQEGRQAGLAVATLDASLGQEAIGVYPGPLVVARTPEGMLSLWPRVEVVVATGAAEIHPVTTGSHLRGLLTARAASGLAAAGIDLGRVAAIGTRPDGVESFSPTGRLRRFEPSAGDPSRVGAVVTVDGQGVEHRHLCDAVSVDLGLSPRDSLLRMGRGMPVRGVGDVLVAPPVPECPDAGVLCPCAGVRVADVASVCARGFRDLELVKRATLAGTGPCQGALCVPYLRSVLVAHGGPLQPAFTARPVTRGVTLGEAAAGAEHQPTPRTALDAEHRRLGARMERLGGWWRPWCYGDLDAEYAAVRHGVSICDVSTLGKMIVSGPGAAALLDHLYPTRISTLAPGRSRYVLLLDERGYVQDDGMVSRESERRFTLSFTSGGATFAELWVRDWADALGLDVRILNQTMARGAINVTGPLAKPLLARAGVAAPPEFLHHAEFDVAGVRCRIFRLSFTGEVSFELHHDAAASVDLWRALLDLGRDLGVRPHGLQALLALRLEKGHLVVGQDTDFDSTPRRLRHEWAVPLDKPDFVGRQAVIRTNRAPIDRQLVGLEADGPAPPEGAVVWCGTEYAGYVTSSTFSPVLGKSVMLAWVRAADLSVAPDFLVAGQRARLADTPFYDPGGLRARA